jgi:hypothetical protein
MDQALQEEAAKIWENFRGDWLSLRIALSGEQPSSRILLYGESLREKVDQAFLGELIAIKIGVILFLHFQRREEPGILSGLVHQIPGRDLCTYLIEPFRNPAHAYGIRICTQPTIAERGYGGDS